MATVTQLVTVNHQKTLTQSTVTDLIRFLFDCRQREGEDSRQEYCSCSVIASELFLKLISAYQVS